METLSKRLLSWASILEDSTLEQARTASRMPFIHPHLALMPDAHLGRGATVGSVIPTLGAIMPAAVGVDIGCGMTAVRTNLRPDQLPDDLAKLRHGIERAVPVGVDARAAIVRRTFVCVKFQRKTFQRRTFQQRTDLRRTFLRVMFPCVTFVRTSAAQAVAARGRRARRRRGCRRCAGDDRET